mgnify:CR=1 FL=1
MASRRAATAVALALALAGCATSAPLPTESVSVTASPSATPTPTIATTTLAVGDCTGKVDLTGGSITDLATLSCAAEHYWEVAAVVTVPEATYPGPDALGETAKTSCGKGFAEYVGVAQQYSRYASAYLAADATAWANPALRSITCLVGSADGGLVGSARDDTRIFPVVGQCTGPQDVAATAIEVIDCASPHHYEVFADKEISSRTAPTPTQEESLFTSLCLAGFTKFVGVDAGKSKYEVTYFLAGSDIWKKVGDHRIVCSAGSTGGGITGSLKGRKK